MRGAWRARAAGIAGAVALLTAAIGAVAPVPAGATSYSPANGTGSSYAGLAFQQWVDDGQTQGLPVNYTPSSSPQGLTQYENGIVQYAGTEAEFSSLLGVPDASIPEGFEYTPDVAGAIAVMYNVQDQAGRAVTYLHLTQRTVARIFMGYVTNWDAPEITAENLGLQLPSHPITIVYRSGQSGTTALFYDFVAHADPADFTPWANAHNLPTQTRIIDLDGSNFAPLIEAVSGSDQQAEDVASQPWSISYDEFAYPKTYGAQVAWIQNGAGKYTQPYALNITAALASATLNPDLSQNLSGVYTSTNPLSYPISAYSYIVTRCAANAQFPTCKGSYPGTGISSTLGAWMSYIACAGQVHMAAIGYAPLPPNLSQDMANSVARITGQPAVTLTGSNCANPRFEGYDGVGSAGPPDPYLNITSLASPGGGNGAGAGSGGGTGSGTTSGGGAAGGSGAGGGSTTAASGGPAGTDGTSGSGTGAGTGGAGPSGAGTTGAGTAGGGTAAGGPAAASTAAAVGKVGGAAAAVGGGTGTSRQPHPLPYLRPISGDQPILPLVLFAILLLIPIVGSRRSWRRMWARLPGIGR